MKVGPFQARERVVSARSDAEHSAASSTLRGRSAFPPLQGFTRG